MDDEDEQQKLRVHLILGTNDFARIKTEEPQRVGRSGEPVAEKTKFGWTLMSPGTESQVNTMLLAQTSVADYEQLCRLDVLGLEDYSTGDQTVVYNEFKEQLTRSEEGWYETDLPWKGNHPALPNNKCGSARRLGNTVRRLEKSGMLEPYDKIIQDQLVQGIIERAKEEPKGREFYIPHKAVLREASETTKLRIVYDASAKAHEKAPSLNDCLHPGPPLQNQLWSVLVRARFHSVAITGDIKPAFLQVRIREDDRDALRFHWYEDLVNREIATFRFTRALFGLGPSPFLLGGVVQQHLDNHRAENPKCVEEIEKSLYVDDLISGGQTVEEARTMRDGATEIFAKAQFTLHKWHSNAVELQGPTEPLAENETFAKQQLNNVDQQGERCGLLGLTWNTSTDHIAIKVEVTEGEATKRRILQKVAKIYDPIGLVSPLTLQGKMLYRDACDSRVTWDGELPRDLLQRWQKWEQSLPGSVSVPRSLARCREKIASIDLHAFGDASGNGVAAAVYAVVTQCTETSTGLVAAKSRLAKRGLSIPRLELVSGHMAANLVENVKTALTGFPVQRVYGWLDSTVALHWIRGEGSYKQFVHNRVEKINAKDYITWKHVRSQDNPADLGSRGGPVSEKNELWWHGPPWLTCRENWPADVVTSANEETDKEAKATRELFAVAIQTEDEIDKLLKRRKLWTTLRVCARICRLFRNAKSCSSQKTTGPVITKEIDEQKQWWIKKTQNTAVNSPTFEEDRKRLNLQANEEGILECRGRIQGDYPIYLPDSALYSERMVEYAHEATIHGGVGMTMAKIRERYWIPRLRRLTKRVIKQCYGCKRVQAKAYANPPPGRLPRDRTEGTSPFEVVGVDYAGPIQYRKTSKKEGKAYIILYSCSLTRGLYLELAHTMETDEFLGSLKRLIARRGRPSKIYSDNGRTFVGAANWLKKVAQDERLNDFLAKYEIVWQFNLSRAPWWGGQFERMVGLVKRALNKTIACGKLTWKELEDVLLDAEIALNNRPLGYVEDDIQLPILTPNALMFGRPNILPEQDPDTIETADLRKRVQYLRRCTDVLWKRWTTEYIRALRETHNLKHKTSDFAPEVGDVVLKSDEKNRNNWKIGVVEKLIRGRDGVVRGVELRTGRSYLQRPVQLLYPLELSCDRTVEEPKITLDPQAPEFKSKRDAAHAAKERIQDILNDE